MDDDLDECYGCHIGEDEEELLECEGCSQICCPSCIGGDNCACEE